MVKRMAIFLLIAASLFGGDITSNIDLLPIVKLKTGKEYNKYLENKNVKLKFVATWCRICIDELSETYMSRSKERYIYVFGEYKTDNEYRVKKFLEKYDHLEDVIFDEKNILMKKFEIKKVPTILEIKRKI